jgi:hypothetical protein
VSREFLLSFIRPHSSARIRADRFDGAILRLIG